MSAAALAVVTCLGLTACYVGQVRAATSTDLRSTFVYDGPRDVITDWDPATSYSNEIIVMENVYESLTTYDPVRKQVLPRLASSWTSSDRGLTWTFRLRAGARFHTGRPVTSTAAKEAIERTVKLQGGPAYIWAPVATIDTPDPSTLVFHLKYAAPLALIASSDYGAYVYDTHATTGDLVRWFGQGHDAGSGPYTVASWTPGQAVQVSLARFPGYWGGWAGRHYTAVDFLVSPQLTTAWQLLQRDQVSFVQQMIPQLFKQAGAVRTVRRSSTASFQNLIAFYNTADGPLTDVRVRRAVQDAVDTDGLVSALNGSVAPASGFVPPGLLGADPGLATHQDLRAAAALLADAGYGPHGRHLTLTLTYAAGDTSQQLFVTLLTSALSGLGVGVAATPEAWNAQWAQAKSSDAARRQDIFVMYWYPDYADAYTWFLNLFRSASPPQFNLSYLHDAALDAQIDRIPQLTATAPAQAAALYTVVQRTVLDDLAAATPLYVATYQRVYRADVDGYVDNPAYPDVVFAYDVSPRG